MESKKTYRAAAERAQQYESMSAAEIDQAFEELLRKYRINRTIGFRSGENASEQ